MFALLPAAVQLQLLLDRDPHGNVQVAKIETERLLLELVEAELAARKATGTFQGKLNGIPHYMVRLPSRGLRRTLRSLHAQQCSMRNACHL